MKQIPAVCCIIPALLALACGTGCGNNGSSHQAADAKAVLSDNYTPPGESQTPETRTQGIARTPPVIGGSPGQAAISPLAQPLERWRQKDRAGSIQLFLEIDWARNEAPFPPGSPLRLREADLVKMSAAERERLVGGAMLQLKDLRDLATAVREKAVAVAASDPELSRRCFVKLDQCGAALDQPEALKILQLTARSIRKLGAASTAQAAR